MRMKELVFEVKRLKGLTNYGLARDLRKMGVEVTTTGINGYMKGVSRVRIDVLCGLVKMLGGNWSRAGELIEKGLNAKSSK